MPEETIFEEVLRDDQLIQKAVGTVAVIGAVMVARYLSLRFLRRKAWAVPEEQLRWRQRIGQFAALLIVLGLIIIWAPELQSLAISIVAIAAAIVIATKELIMCVSGSFVRASADGFTVGDRVEVAGWRGDVIGYNLFTTTLLEIGSSHQQTGRALVLPNSLFLTSPVVNETFTEDFVLHTFAVPLKLDQDWPAAEQVLLEAAEKVCGAHLEPATRHLNSIADKHGLKHPNVEPRVSIRMPEAGKIDLLVRVPAPARKKGRVEREILRFFLESEAGRRLAGRPPVDG